jgi:hypothetical protein
VVDSDWQRARYHLTGQKDSISCLDPVKNIPCEDAFTGQPIRTKQTLVPGDTLGRIDLCMHELEATSKSSHEQSATPRQGPSGRIKRSFSR